MLSKNKEENILKFIERLPEALEERKLVLFIIDGLGTNKIKVPRMFKKITYRTVFPSSTPTFFYSFHSLLEPKSHGFLDWYMRFDRLNEPITIPPWRTISGKELKLKKDVKKKDVFPFKSLSEIIWKRGFSSHYYTPFPYSTFTIATSRKAKITRMDYFSQIFPLPDEDFIFIYWPSVDLILHKRFKTETFQIEIEILEMYIKILWKKLPRDSMLAILSDHGLTKVKKRYLLPTIEGVYPVGGGRVGFYRDVELDKVERNIRKRKIPATVFHIKEIEGFDGKISKRCVENFGDIVVIANNGIGFKYPFEKRSVFDVGYHSGKSKEEMYVNVWTGIK